MTEIQPSERAGVFRKSSIEFLKRLASALNSAALKSQKESVHKIARQENEGFTHLINKYLCSAKDADLSKEEISDSLKLLSWFIHRLWKSLVRHFFQLQNS